MELKVKQFEAEQVKVRVKANLLNSVIAHLSRLSSSRMLSPLVVIIIWEFVGQMKFVDPVFLPAPSAILKELLLMIKTGELFVHIGYSMGRMIVGFSLACVVGVLLGLTMAWFRFIDRIFEPLIDLIRPVSPLAILPLAILWLGIGHSSKIFIIFYGALFPIVLNTYAGIKGVEKATVDAAKTLGATKVELLFKVAIPSALPIILTGIRISSAIAMIVVVASEMVAATAGLGYLILTAEQVYKTEEMFVGILCISILGFGLDRLIKYIQRKVTWYTELISI
jgi:ABC-type nitrate/sulfonate/bicarbonate transport system permease component